MPQPVQSGIRALGEWPLQPGVTVDLISYPAGFSYPDHAHQTLDLSLVLTGTLREGVGRATHRIEPLDVAVKAPGTEHRNRFGEDEVTILRLRMDRGALDALDGDADEGRYGLHRRGELAAQLVSIAREARSGVAPGEAETRVADALAVAWNERTGSARAPGWLALVEEAIDDQLESELRVADLATLAGCHPVHLARVFRRVHGTSVTAFIRRRRVRAALRKARLSRRSLAFVAAESGFADQAHMCRCFRRELGAPPSALRALFG